MEESGLLLCGREHVLEGRSRSRLVYRRWEPTRVVFLPILRRNIGQDEVEFVDVFERSHQGSEMIARQTTDVHPDLGSRSCRHRGQD